MFWKKEWKALAAMSAVFLTCYYLPVGNKRFDLAVGEALYLVQDYARLHVVTCLLPAFFIAGAIGVFISHASVMKYLGADANKALAYAVASVSGTILAVCSCTVLPLFAGIYRMGAGLGPATAFLYSGPAINILAIAMTARILGPRLGVARAVGAVLFSVLIGLFMHFIFRNEEAEKVRAQGTMGDLEVPRPLWQNALYFGSMIGVLVFANWGAPDPEASGGLWSAIHGVKWIVTALFAAGLGIILLLWFDISKRYIIGIALPVIFFSLVAPGAPVLAFAAGIIGLSIVTSSDKGEAGDWFSATWTFAKQILPLLFIGVLVAGLLLGRPGENADNGLIPARWIADSVGGNSLGANLFASVAGAFMYFATLTEVMILDGLISNGMGQGPALALLLAGPALSLPNMLVIRSIMGTKKTVVFVILVVAMATVSGMMYGMLFGTPPPAAGRL